MEKKEAMKIMMGRTWKAKMTPYGPAFVPNCGPKRKLVPASEKSSMALTPLPMA